MFIAAYDIESPQSYLIQIPEQKAKDILLQFGNNLENIAQSLKILNSRLVLLSPVSLQSNLLLPCFFDQYISFNGLFDLVIHGTKGFSIISC